MYTSIWQPENMPAAVNAMPVNTSFMQRLPGIFSHHRWFFPLYPLAFQSFDLSGYDLVITNTQGGLRHNARQQVLDARGEPIPRLYTAGEIGSLFGHLYMLAGNNSECFIGGQIAGRNAAHEPAAD